MRLIRVFTVFLGLGILSCGDGAPEAFERQLAANGEQDCEAMRADLEPFVTEEYNRVRGLLTAKHFKGRKYGFGKHDSRQILPKYPIVSMELLSLDIPAEIMTGTDDTDPSRPFLNFVTSKARDDCVLKLSMPVTAKFNIPQFGSSNDAEAKGTMELGLRLNLIASIEREENGGKIKSVVFSGVETDKWKSKAEVSCRFKLLGTAYCKKGSLLAAEVTKTDKWSGKIFKTYKHLFTEGLYKEEPPQYGRFTSDASAHGASYCLSVVTKTKKPVSWPCEYRPTDGEYNFQLWKFEGLLLKHKKFGTCLTSGDGNSLALQKCFASDKNQHFYFDGRVIRLKGSKRRLDIRGGTPNKIETDVIANNSGSQNQSNQSWKFTSGDLRWFKLASAKNPDLCLSAGTATNANDDVSVFSCGSKSQRILWRHDENGRIRNHYESKCLFRNDKDVALVRPCTNADARVKMVTDGNRIKNTHNNKCLDVVQERKILGYAPFTGAPIYDLTRSPKVVANADVNFYTCGSAGKSNQTWLREYVK